MFIMLNAFIGVGSFNAHPLGTEASSVLLLEEVTHIMPSSLQRLQGAAASHYRKSMSV